MDIRVFLRVFFDSGFFVVFFGRVRVFSFVVVMRREVDVGWVFFGGVISKLGWV